MLNRWVAWFAVSIGSVAFAQFETGDPELVMGRVFVARGGQGRAA